MDVGNHDGGVCNSKTQWLLILHVLNVHLIKGVH